jgi:putative DNA primase/helicase
MVNDLEDVKSVPMQTEDFCDLYDEDENGNPVLVMTADERERASKFIPPVEDFLKVHYNKKGEEIIEGVDVDKVAEFIENKFNIRTIFGIREETIEVYEKGVWSIKGRGIIKAEIERVLQKYCKNNVVNEILEKIKRRTEIDREEADKLPDYKRCIKNGVLDLENPEDIKLLPHDKKYNFRNKFPIVYNPKVNCNVTIDLMRQAFYEEDLSKIQEWFGFHLVRRYFKKKMAIFHGPKDTSKTVILNLLTFFCGGNVSGLSLQEISRAKPFDLLALKDKDANIHDDLSSSDMKAVGGIKKVVGDGFIDGEQKFGDKNRFRNTAKQSHSCNKIPNPGEDIDDEAYYDRILLFPLDNVIPEEKQDDHLIDKLTTPEELSGLLNWAIEGYKRLIKNNKFSNEKTAEEIKFLMLQNGNSLAEFSSEVLTESAGEKISKDNLYTVYCKWCSEHKPKLSPDSKEKMGRSLTKFTPYAQASSNGKERYWLNVKINSKYDTYDTIPKNMSDYLESNKSAYDNDIYNFSESVISVRKPESKESDFTDEEYKQAGYESKEEYEKMLEEFKDE